MGFGSAFTSAWNKASNAVQQKVAQVATSAKQAANQVVNKVQNTAQKAQEQAQKQAKFISQQAAKAVSTVKQTAKAVTNQVAKAVETAKKNIPVIANAVKQKLETAKQKAEKAREQAKQILDKAKNEAETKVESLSKKAKNAAKALKKDFSKENLVKAAVQVCPFMKEGYGLAKAVDEAKEVIKSEKSKAEKRLKGLSVGISAAKTLYDLYDNYKTVLEAAKPVKALTENAISGVKKSIALDLAVSGLTGGLDVLAKNADRKDISKANKIGRFAFGAGKGIAKSALATGMGAGTGALIGLAFTPIFPGAAVVGAKLGATFLSPFFEKTAERITDHFLTDNVENKAGQLGDKTAAVVKGVWTGAANLIRPPN